MMARSKRDHTPVAALFLDLDGFKDINDTLGHHAGDQLLVEVGARLSNVVRGEDTVGRLGGDEFVVLAEGALLTAGAEVLAERILDVLEIPFEIAESDIPLSITASIGIALGDRVVPEDLLRDADTALYEAKAAGKRCATVFSPPMRESIEHHRLLDLDLQAALDTDQFFLLYQPTVDLSSGAMTGVEALLRWRHPERGVVQPNEFIPVLQSNGLIVPVGRWVIEEACRQGAAWQRQGHPLSVSVNVSTKQLERDQVVGHVRDALATTGLEPSMLILELTESTLMHDHYVTVAQLKRLKGLGVRLAIDDFGIGYSSLINLRPFPIDMLKIERSFVSAIGETAAFPALIRTLGQLGKVLGLETVAQGIENDDQRRLVTEENVDTGQGFHFARPLTAEELDHFLTGTLEQSREPTP
jgi:diguanylate cyclase (GGDEF)-like protein